MNMCLIFSAFTSTRIFLLLTNKDSYLITEVVKKGKIKLQNNLVIVRWFRKTRDCKEDRQCTCNVTLMRVHETIVAMEKQYVLHISIAC